jgi:hypothetical protein
MGRLDLALSPRLSGSFAIAGQRWYDGSFAVRDGFLLVSIDVIDEPDRVLRIKPGLTLPVGAVSSGLDLSPLTTGSFDPWLQVDALIGGTWIGGLTGTLRAPLSRGSDGLRQGPRLRLDLKGARRFAPGVAWTGLTSVAQAGGEVTDQTSFELSLAGGWVHELNGQWALGLNLRIPLVERGVPGGVPFLVAAGLTIARVNSPQEPGEAGHSANDGHGH